MVQILPPVDRRQSFGQRLGAGVGDAINLQMQREAIRAQDEAKQRLLSQEYGLKGDLERQKGNKPLNPLQESQKTLNEAKVRDLENEEALFNKGMPSTEEDSEGNTTPNIQKFSDDKLRQLSSFKGKPGSKGVLGNMAQSELDRRLEEKKELGDTAKNSRKEFESDREYHSKVSRPIVQAANERLKLSDVNRGVRQQLRNDISSGETSGLYPFIVDKLGLESFRNPESARFSNEVKNLFVGSLNEIPGARPNQFIERFLSTAQPLIGRSPEANLSVMDVADLVEDIRDEQARLELQIAKEDSKKLGYVKDDVVERAREKMGDFVNRRQEKMAMQIRERHENEMDDSQLINEMIGGNIMPGTYVTPRTMKILYLKNGKDMKKAIDDANKYGMKFPEYIE